MRYGRPVPAAGVAGVYGLYRGDALLALVEESGGLARPRLVWAPAGLSIAVILGAGRRPACALGRTKGTWTAMERWRGLDAIPAGWGRCVLTIGVFDGLHRGHQELVGATVRQGPRTRRCRRC